MTVAGVSLLMASYSGVMTSRELDADQYLHADLSRRPCVRRDGLWRGRWIGSAEQEAPSAKFTAEEVWFSKSMENHHGGVIFTTALLFGANGGNGGGLSSVSRFQDG
jgi:hypothetical protein